MSETNRAQEFKSFVLNNITYFIAATLAVVYAAASALSTSSTDNSLLGIIRYGFLFLLMNIAVGNLLNTQGLFKGNASPEVKLAKERKATIKNASEQYLDKIDVFCETKNKAALRKKRMDLLCVAGLAYSDYFTEAGDSIKGATTEFGTQANWFKRLFRQETRQQQRARLKSSALRSAYKARVREFTPSLIMSDGKARAAGHCLNTSMEQQVARFNVFGTATKFLVMIIFGLYTIDTVASFSLAALIWRMMELAIVFTLGFMQMQRANLYMRTTYASKINEQADLLHELRVSYSNEKVVQAKVLLECEGYSFSDSNGEN